MDKIGLIIFAALFTFVTAVAFDFVVFVLKSAPKQAYFSRRLWKLALLAAIALVYWYMNGMKFL